MLAITESKQTRAAKCMAENPPQFAPELHEDYLRLLARLWLPRRAQRKLDASDLVQDALLKAHAKGDQFEGKTDAQYKAWLRKILRNCLLDDLKKLRVPEDSINQAEDASRWTEKRLATNAPSVGSRVAHDELLELLGKTLAELPNDSQDVLALHYLGGLKVGQIAEELGRTRASVAGLIRRGLERLREDARLRESFGDE
jgi:RNA polymerase sigma-70 factor (ECF subfamily)